MSTRGSVGGQASEITRTYKSPVDSAYGAKGAHGSNGQSELV